VKRTGHGLIRPRYILLPRLMAQAVSFYSAAARRFQLSFWGPLAAAGLLQFALFAYATAPGLVGTGDSRFYLHAAQTLRDTGHLLNPDGTPYRYWPPLYPVLLRGCGTLAGVRALHGLCLMGSLVLWGWLSRQLLPARRAGVLPWLLALSTPWLLVSKFVWAESGFLLLFGAYAVLLFHGLRTARLGWWGAATAIGFLLPLQRTLGLFLLAGVGAGLLVGEWYRLPLRHRWLLALHLALSSTGGVLWQWYALLLAGPSRYHPGRGWSQLLSSAADYGFVLSRWLLPLPTAGRTLVPGAVWAVVLAGLLGLMWPRRSTVSLALDLNARHKEPDSPVALTAFEALDSRNSAALGAESFQTLPAHLLRRTLWSTTLVLVALVAALTVFAQSAAGVHDAERYASILFAPVVLLLLAVWPARAPRWLGQVVVAAWLLAEAVRVGHVASDLRRVPPLAPGSFAGPGPHGQQVGAVGE
jgi:hypothetical protein